MRFMMMLKATPETEAGVPPSPELMAEVGALVGEMTAAGILVAGDGLTPSSQGKRIEFGGGKVTRVIDGPFAETKELVSGFVIINVPSWDEALSWVEKFAAVQGAGLSEVRPLFEPDAFEAQA